MSSLFFKKVTTEKICVFFNLLSFLSHCESQDKSDQKPDVCSFRYKCINGEKWFFFGLYVGKFEWRKHRVLQKALRI